MGSTEPRQIVLATRLILLKQLRVTHWWAVVLPCLAQALVVFSRPQRLVDDPYLSETLGPLARGGLNNSGAMANHPVGQTVIAEGLINTLNPAAVEALRSAGAEQVVDLEDQ